MGPFSSRTLNRPASPAIPSTEPLSPILALGAGCYWGTEKFVRHDFQKKFPGSIKSCSVGFMACNSEIDPQFRDPSYEQVCTGQTGHIEVLFIELNEPEKHFEELIRFFFQFHDPTTPRRQGNDRGLQYASWIFSGDGPQALIAKRVRDELQKAIDQGLINGFAGRTISTQISPIQRFTKAQESHQRYLSKNPGGYCNHRLRFSNWPKVL